jgi:hypothetical protein
VRDEVEEEEEEELDEEERLELELEEEEEEVEEEEEEEELEEEDCDDMWSSIEEHRAEKSFFERKNPVFGLFLDLLPLIRCLTLLMNSPSLSKR